MSKPIIRLKEVDLTTLGNPPADRYYIGIDSNDGQFFIKDEAGTVTKPQPSNLGGLTDVDLTGLSTNDLLQYDGANWVPFTLVYGTNLRVNKVDGPLTTTSTTPASALSELLASVEAGDYLLHVSYGWNHDDTGSDFQGIVTYDGNILGDVFGNGFSHVQEPQDSGGTGGGSGTNQQYAWSKIYYLPGESAGTKQLDIDYATSSGGAESTIWDITYKLIRIA